MRCACVCVCVQLLQQECQSAEPVDEAGRVRKCER